MADKKSKGLNKYLAAAAAAVLVAIQSITARMAGGGLGAQKLPEWLTWLPELFFALAIGAAIYVGHPEGIRLAFDIPYVLKLDFYLTRDGATALSSTWSYLWMQTGHHTAYHMTLNPAAALERKQTLSVIVDPICKLLNQPLGGTFYCWLFMGLKGVLIHAPLGLFALPAAVLWPLAYYLGRKVIPRYFPRFDGGAAAELFSGAFSGLLTALRIFL